MKRYVILFTIMIIVIASGYLLNIGKYTSENADITNDEETFKKNIVNYGGRIHSRDKMIWYDGNHLCYSDLSIPATRNICYDPECAHNTDDCIANFPMDVAITHLYYKNEKIIALGSGLKTFEVYEGELDGSKKRKVAEYDPEFDIIEDYRCFSDNELDKAYIALISTDDSVHEVDEEGFVRDQKEKIEFLVYDFNKRTFKKVYDYSVVGYQYSAEAICYDNNTFYGEFYYLDKPYVEIYDRTTGDMKSPELYSYVHSYKFSFDTINDTVNVGEDYHEKTFYSGSKNGVDYYIEADDNGFIRKGLSAVMKDGKKKYLAVDLLKNEIAINWDLCVLNDYIVLKHHIYDPDKEYKGEMYLLSFDGKVIEEYKGLDYYICGEVGDYYVLSELIRDFSFSGGRDYYIKKEDLDGVSNDKNIIPISLNDLQ